MIIVTCWCNRCNENFDANFETDWDSQDYEPAPVCPQCGRTDRVSWHNEDQGE